MITTNVCTLFPIDFINFISGNSQRNITRSSFINQTTGVYQIFSNRLTKVLELASVSTRKKSYISADTIIASWYYHQHQKYILRRKSKWRYKSIDTSTMDWTTCRMWTTRTWNPPTLQISRLQSCRWKSDDFRKKEILQRHMGTPSKR